MMGVKELLEKYLKYPIVISNAAWRECIDCGDGDLDGEACQVSMKRLTYLLQSLYVGLIYNPDSSVYELNLDKYYKYFSKAKITLKAVIKMGDKCESMINIKLPEEEEC